MNQSRQKYLERLAVARTLRMMRDVPKPRSCNAAAPPEFNFRSYQRPVVEDHVSGILVLHWSRQIGKSHTLAAWALCRLFTRPGRLVTVLSNSRVNGAEFLGKCAALCHASQTPFEQTQFIEIEELVMELRVTINGQTGRIKALAANPRTARGFSGDLILDEFAFHENSAAIWEAAEPILSSNPDFLCRIASTGNGRHNLFYQFATPATEAEARAFHEKSPQLSDGPGMTFNRLGHRLSRVSRTMAHQLGVPIFDPATREELAPESARALALDKAAYDQNYECVFADESLTLLGAELIAAAEGEGIGTICNQEWSSSVLETLAQCNGPLFAGFDVARHGDLSVITVIEKLGEVFYARAILRMGGLRLPDQQQRLGDVCRLPQFRRVAIDMTGLGWGLVEYAQNEFGASKISGVNFSSSVSVTQNILGEGRRADTVRVPEALAMELLRAYENRRIRHPRDSRLRDDLRKPERITTPGGRVSIAATRDEAGHADHFWSLALALEATSASESTPAAQPLRLHDRSLF